VTPFRDLVLGGAVIAVISAAYLSTGQFVISARGSAAMTEIVPTVTCVARDPVNAGSYIVTFGYERHAGPTVVHVPLGSGGDIVNYVDVGGRPLPPHPQYNVPTAFDDGARTAAFSVRALDSQRVTWWLTSNFTRSATATSSTQPACAPGQMPRG
jgi:hypothetical protein